MCTSDKVGELFRFAGSALCQLGELTTELHTTNEQAAASGKWTDHEIEMLMNSIKRFCQELNQISEIIKDRTISQMETQMRKKAYQDRGLSPPPPLPAPSSVHTNLQLADARLSNLQQQQPMSSCLLSTESSLNRDSHNMSVVTLSALNATEADIDIEGFVEHSVPKKIKGLDTDSDCDPGDL